MPYVTQESKDRLEAGHPPLNTGDLTYLYTLALLGERRRVLAALADATQVWLDTHGVRYSTLCAVVGSLECARREYIRRALHSVGDAPPLSDLEDYLRAFYNERVAPYEDTKIEENGDVYA